MLFSLLLLAQLSALFDSSAGPFFPKIPLQLGKCRCCATGAEAQPPIAYAYLLTSDPSSCCPSFHTEPLMPMGSALPFLSDVAARRPPVAVLPPEPELCVSVKGK